MKQRMLRLLWLAPSVISVAYFAFWACAPVAYIDPPLASGGPKGIVGAAGVYSHQNAASATGYPNGRTHAGDGQLWFQRRFERLGFGLTAAAGQAAIVSAGGYFRVHVLDRPRFRLATDLQAGAVFVGAALPMVANLTPTLEWYVAPWASFRAGNVLRLPTGLRYWSPGGPVLGLEAGVAGLRDGNDTKTLELWGALALGYPFSRPD